MMAAVKKLHGREFYKKLGCPKRILAPMVDQSELPWRILARRSGADLCYSPMFHSRLFSESEDYRGKVFSTRDIPEEKPLIIQFCGNDPEIMLKAAQLAVPYCDAVDLNLGCPQGIAKKGKYGSFLQENWPLIESIIKKLHEELPIPVTAKIRIFPDPKKTLEYAKMILNAGASFLAVHGRFREQKGQFTGVADWEQISMLRKSLPSDTVLFANGNILHSCDIDRCIEATGVDGVMSAEGSLYNPKIFLPSNSPMNILYPRVDDICDEYLNIIREFGLDTDYSTRSAMKGHMFKLMRPLLSIHTDIRSMLATECTPRDFESFPRAVAALRKRLDECKEKGEIREEDEPNEENKDELGYPKIPWWRVQPYVRPMTEPSVTKRKLEEAPVSEAAVKKLDVGA
ncbi:tRNA dihydrouridine synthase Dus1 [Schizosaccharomyces octosporus yFS286]|uniref:tRNA-dihydrouridine(16/17) synthase [NAD(P)(+)] n=1 Tax=Schizosaccharomyces octosporus (strain yFS286) TaxID=483514 RepID=S9PX49_SCHOY|nr:tRNA dihydrouridine synthase Dus1 [Schizosaccharomyces octosporus yFS286]EPX72562.1 tRNA dihydrouridine synthase Dus1 [Schizosaccharomyces octosporus yFS286]